MDYVKKFLNVEGIIGQGAFGRVLVTSPLQNQQSQQTAHHQQQATSNLLQITNRPHTPATSEDSDEGQKQQQFDEAANNNNNKQQVLAIELTKSPSSCLNNYKNTNNNNNQPQANNRPTNGFGCDTSNNYLNPNVRYALKCVHPILRPQRLANELRHLRDLGGIANVVQMHTAHFYMGSLFIVMELIEHDRFVDIVADLELNEIVMFIKNLLIALEHVHAHSIMHRDIKPANFLYNRKNKKFLLVDFGLAQLVRPRSALFTNRPNTNANTPNHKTSQLPTTPTTTTNNRRLTNPLFSNNKGLGSTPKKVHHITAPQLMKSTSPYVNLKSTATHIIHQNPARHYINITPTGSPNVAMKRQLNDVPIANDFNTMMLKKLRVSGHNDNDPREPVKLTVGAYESPITHNDSTDRRGNNHQHYNFSTPTVPIRRNLGSKCDCRGKPRTCTICLSRPEFNAPKSGTPGFKAPEVLLRYPNQTTAVDIWSSGCILACLLSGHSPFFRDVDDNASLAEIITVLGSQKVISAAKAIGIRLIVDPKKDGIDLKELCLSIRSCPGKRQIPSIPDSIFDLLVRMLDPNPLTRITASVALQHDCFHPMTEI